jgi:putative oxidoreductase
MDLAIALTRAHLALARLFDLLQSPMLLYLRVYIAWQFWKSGWLKISAWDQTLELFRSEYHVPLLPPYLAAVAGTAGELVFPALLVAGLFSRVAALGVFAVNAMAVVSYSHVLLTEGFEAALGQHVLWGLIALVLMVCGPGHWTLDRAMEARVAARCRPQTLPMTP